MFKKLFILIVLIALVSGCGTTYELESQWRPLTKLAERGDLSSFGLPNTALTTISNRVYVKNIQEFLHKNPINSIDFNALMSHEKVHAVRQIDHGTLPWISRYVRDKQFMWEEEQIAHYVELKYRQAQGQISHSNDPNTLSYIDRLATSLSTMYENLQGSMVSFGDARKWIIDVVDGRWKPEDHLSNLKGL